jgi:hypothetical protein
VWADDKDLGPGEQRHDAFQGGSIEQALEIAARQNPGKVCEVTFPINPESFFFEDSVATFRQLAA